MDKELQKYGADNADIENILGGQKPKERKSSGASRPTA